MPSKKSAHTKKRVFHNKQRTSRSGHFWRNFGLAFLGFAFVLFILSPASDFNPSWGEPTRLVSKDGHLDASLTAQKSEIFIDGKKVDAPHYNDSYIGPTFDVKGGDTLIVHLENSLDQVTNLHFHGAHVSPRGNSDNVLLAIQPGETFDYEYKLPVNHPAGLYWYHPHWHPNVEQQVLGGMAGAVIVRGEIDDLPGIKDVPEKLLILTTQDGEDQNTPVRLVNGQEMPPLYIRPGEIQRWRILNASADDYYNFALPGQKLHVISRDGNTLDRVVEEDSEVMAPGDRIEILVKGGLWGTYNVDSLPFNQGFARYKQETIMHMVVAGFPVWPKEFPSKLIPYEDLRDARVNNHRTLTFSIGGDDDNPEFLLDNKEFNPNTVNQVMILGTTEEWKLVNESKEAHPFHIHINPFQVISINGEAVNRHGYDDTFSIPPKSTVIIRTQYKDFDGKYVLHCHILFHEDHGMMQVVEVIKPGYGLSANNGMPDREGLMDMMPHTSTSSDEEQTTDSTNRYTKWK